MATKKHTKAGRPKVVWSRKDCETFKALCAQFNTEEDICAVMGVNSDTLLRLINEHLYEEITGHKRRGTAKKVYFSDAFKKFSANGRMSLRREQYRLAMGGDRTMLIWLGKQHLGQRDEVEVEHATAPVIELGVEVKKIEGR